jgi:hypothetical protein
VILAGEVKRQTVKRHLMRQNRNDAASLNCRGDVVSLRFPCWDGTLQCLTPPLNGSGYCLLLTPTLLQSLSFVEKPWSHRFFFRFCSWIRRHGEDAM